MKRQCLAFATFGESRVGINRVQYILLNHQSQQLLSLLPVARIENGTSKAYTVTYLPLTSNHRKRDTLSITDMTPVQRLHIRVDLGSSPLVPNLEHKDSGF